MSCTLDLDRGHTLDELLQGCIAAFDAQGKVRDPHLVRLFLMMHPWYLPPAELADKLLHIIEESGGSDEGPSLCLKISHLVRYWVRAFPGELAGDPELLGRIRVLREALGRGSGGDPDTRIDLDSLPSPPGGEQEEPPPRPPTRRKTSLLLDHLEAAELAEHLTHLEHRAFARVHLQDYRSFARRGCAAGSPALQRVIALSNGVSRWVQLLVLSPPAPPQRARVLTRFLHVAQRLLELRNFNTLMAVVGGLGHGSITRLRQTLALLPPDVTKLWGRLSEVLGSAGNYRRYRGLLGGAGGGGGFRLPALGVHLRDLVALEEALPDWGGPARPHPAKLQQRFAILGGLLGGGEQGPPVPADPDLLHLLTVSLELGQTEEQLYQLSLQREPRTRAPHRAGRGRRGPLTRGLCTRRGPLARGCPPSPVPLRLPQILGLHKQGLKCRTCGLRCHARCRERLRVECRRRTQSVASDAPPGPPGPPPRSFSFSLPQPRRSSSALHPPETPEELQEVEDGVFDIHL
ncbi:RAS guanyl-releasing protein 2 [Buteo buteo]|uniref:RAS guanyl-releasing protein 2 n=1 Tax=Buteo buteo TaxID=30397 RepID=UPI003EBE26A5